MSHNKLANHVRKAKRKVYASLPAEIRTLHALMRLASPRRKRAFSEGQITKLVEQMLDREGIRRELEGDGLEIPTIDWGKIFKVGVNSMARKLNLEHTQREDFLNDVVGDMIMGQSIMSLRDTGPWKRNLMEQIEDWVREGYNDNRIKASLTKWVKMKVSNLYKRWKAETGDADTGFQQGTPDDGYEGRDTFEDLFTLDGLSSGQLSGYYSLMRSNPAAKQLIEKIKKELNQRYDDLGMIWEAYMNNPASSMRELLKVDVTFKAGARGKVPLWRALGFEEGDSSNPGKLGYRVKKLRKFLRNKWPDIDDVLRDLSKS